jgi:hypothetical protein
MNDPAASPPAMTVISTDPDGAVRAMVDADAAGVATIDVVAGGDVTARYAAPTGRVAVRSFLGVAPGDDLLAGVLGERTSIGDFYYGWTQSTVTQAEVHDRCGSGRYTPNPGGPSAARIWLRLRADCADASPVVFWSDRGSAVDPAVTRAPGGTHTFTTLTAPTTHTDLVRGIPAGVTLATITTIGDYRGVTFADGNTRFGAPTGSTFTSTRPWPVGVTPSGAYYGINKKGFGSVGVATRGAAYATDLDLSAHWLPFIGAAQTDPATRRVTWDQEAGRAGDGAYVTIVFDDAGTTIFWQVVGPAAPRHAPAPGAAASVRPGLADRRRHHDGRHGLRRRHRHDLPAVPRAGARVPARHRAAAGRHADGRRPLRGQRLGGGRDGGRDRDRDRGRDGDRGRGRDGDRGRGRGRDRDRDGDGGRGARAST